MTRKSLITTTFVLAPIAAGVAIVAVLWQVRSARAAQEFDEAKQAYIDAGGWASLEDIELPDVPDDENAATLYRTVWPKAEAWRDRHGWGGTNRLAATLTGDGAGHHQPFSDDEAAQILTEFDDALDVVVEASRRDACVWNAQMFQTERLWDVLLPWVSPGGIYSRLLCLRAIDRAEHERWDDAGDDLLAALRLAEHLCEPPMQIGMRIRSDVQHAVLRTVEQIYRDGPLPDASVVAAIERVDVRAGGRQAMLFEGMLAMMDRADIRDFLKVIAPPPQHTGERWRPAADRAMVLKDSVHNASLIESTIAERDGELRGERDEPWSRLAQTMFLSIDRFDSELARTEALRRLALAAIDLRRHRAEHGEYPESWPMPDDPVTGDAMQYERTDDGFTLRSDAAFAIDRMSPSRERLEWRWR